MNHDATHCDDYKKSKCPKQCYRAQLTQDLRKRPYLFFLPISWAHFKGTQECPIDKGVSKKMSCKDCIHSEVCWSYSAALENFDICNPHNIGKDCDDFKPYDRFVELPCKVGDTVYVLTADSAIDEFFGKEKKNITKLQVMEFMVQKDNKILLLFVTTHVWGKPSEEIGKTVFLTHEEAEAALKELSDDTQQN